MGERAVDGAFATIITIFLVHSQGHLEITNILLASSIFLSAVLGDYLRGKKEFGFGNHFSLYTLLRIFAGGACGA